MAEIHHLLTAMDRLWFHHIILLTQPISIFCSKSMVGSSPSSSLSSSSLDDSQLEEEKPSTNSASKDDCNNEVEEEAKEKGDIHKAENSMSQKLPQSAKKTKLRTLHRPCKSLNYVHDIEKSYKLHRTLSSMTYYDLEQIEVQGFMDLGFQFEKDQITPRTVSVIPGLQRLGEGHLSNLNDDPYGNEEDNKGEVVRPLPYLSEAWKVKKPNSPLLRLRMARVNNTEDMKKCLKLWARIVASSMQLD